MTSFFKRADYPRPFALSLLAALSISVFSPPLFAQSDDLTLPDLPMVEESAPQEAPFANSKGDLQNEFEAFDSDVNKEADSSKATNLNAELKTKVDASSPEKTSGDQTLGNDVNESSTASAPAIIEAPLTNRPITSGEYQLPPVSDTGKPTESLEQRAARIPDRPTPSLQSFSSSAQAAAAGKPVSTPEQAESDPRKNPWLQAPPSTRAKDRTARNADGMNVIDHPLAAKGLIRIEKDGSYIYKTEKGVHTEASSLRFGSLQPPNITSADKSTDFKQMYSSSNVPILLYDYEWQPFTSFGKLGMQAGFGFFTAQGSGRFIIPDPTTGNTKAEEKYTFIAIPLNVGVVYRMEYSDRQWLAPYIAGGLSYIPLVEFRDDSKSPHAVGTPGAYGAGGLMFNVSSFDRETAYTLNSEYGIKNLWVALELRYLKSFSPDLDLSAPIINLGVTVDY